MNDSDIKIDFGGVQETLLLPLLARARETEKKNPIICDTYARDMVAKIDYDFSKIEKGTEGHQFIWAVRAYNFDNTVRTFLKNKKNAVIVNIGAGLDTTFQRTDNGSTLWINIDLPDVVELRQKLIPDSERETTIAKSVFDFTWIDDITLQTKDRSILFMAAGVLCYFNASEVEILFRKLANTYPSAYFVFDAMSWFSVWATNLTIMRKSGMDSSALLKWYLKKAFRLSKWVDTIRVVEEYPMLSRVQPRDDWGKKIIRDLKIANFLHLNRLYNMVYVQL